MDPAASAELDDLIIHHPLDDLVPVPQECPNSFPLEIDWCEPLDVNWLDVDFAWPTDVYPHLPVGDGDEKRLTTLPRSDKLHLAQTWLFYGLLSGFLSKPLRKEDVFYDRGRIGGPTLRGLFHGWHVRLLDMNKAERSDEMNRLRYLTEVGSDTVNRLDLCFDEDSQLVDLELIDYSLAGTLLCVKLLVEYLSTLLDANRYIRRYAKKEFKYKYQAWFKESLKLADNAPHAWPAELHRVDLRRWNKIFFSVFKPGERASSDWTGRLLQKWFDDNGWCRVAFRSLCETHDYTTVYYLSRVRRLEDLGAHFGCRKSEICLAYELTGRERGLYHPQHTEGQCECPLVPLVAPEFEAKLCDMIDQHKIPIVSMRPDAPNLDLRIEPYDGTFRYTAISHVWSDGMGNDEHSQVHRCQLRSIGLQIAKLEREFARCHVLNFYSMYDLAYRAWSRVRQPRVYFWLDTLCIPAKITNGSAASDTTQAGRRQTWTADVNSSDEDTDPERDDPSPRAPQPERRKELRNKAMRHITPIYQAAEQVLVIDKEIEQLQSPSRDLITSIVLGSKWARRAWTFQEGSTARDCRFKIANGTPAILRDLEDRDWFDWRIGHVDDSTTIRWQAAWLQNKEWWKRKTKAPIRVEGVRISQFWVPLKTILAESLNEFRKRHVQLRESFISSGSETSWYRKGQATVFVEVWNNLKVRNATSPSDTHIIFSSLIDLDSSALLSMKHEGQKFPTIVRNCSRLPLSILFNTRLNVYRYPHMHLSELQRRDLWIPTQIEGDRLSAGDVLVNDSIASPLADQSSVLGFLKSSITGRRKAAEPVENQPCQWLRLGSVDKKSHLSYLFAVERTDYGNFEGRTVAQMLFECDDGYDEEEPWIVEFCLPHRRIKRNRRLAERPDAHRRVIYGPRVTQQDRRAFFAKAEAEFNQAQKVLYILDESLGSIVPSGYKGRGARFTVLEETSTGVYVQFDCPLVFWTRQQWAVSRRLFKAGQSRKEMPRIITTPVSQSRKKPKIFVQYDGNSHPDKLGFREARMRPMATIQSATFVAGLFAGLIAIGAIAYPIAFVKCPPGPESLECLAIIGSSTFGGLALISALVAFFGYHWYYRWRTNVWLRSYGIVRGKQKPGDEGPSH